MSKRNVSARVLCFEFDRPALTGHLYEYGNENGKPFAIFRDYKDKGNLIADMERFCYREKMNLIFLHIIY